MLLTASSTNQLSRKSKQKTAERALIDALYLFRHKGSTYTAAAMKEVIEKVISKSDGWRQGSGPAVCSGVIIDGTCYWIPKNYVSASQMDDACAASMNGGEPAVIQLKYLMMYT